MFIKAILWLLTNILVVCAVILLSIYSIQPSMIEEFVLTKLYLAKAIGCWILFWASIELYASAKKYKG